MSGGADLGRAYDVFEKVGALLDGKADYWDILYDWQSSCAITKDNVEERVSTPEMEGILVRAFKGGVWFTSSTHRVEAGAVEEIARRLIKPVPAPGKVVKLSPLKPQRLDRSIPSKRSPIDTPLEEKLECVRQYHKAASSIDRRIVNARISYTDSVVERAFCNSEGSLMHQSVPRTRFAIVPIGRDGGRIESDFLSKGGTAGFELMDGLDAEGLAKKATDGTLGLLGAKVPPSGEFTVVVDPSMAGMIAHESFGHGLEADQVVRDRSYLAALVGKRVASEHATIIDSPALPGGWGSFVFDDEGVPARENVLVEGGYLRGFLHDRYTASALGAEPTSNCRVESYLTKHFVRMTNTYFKPGDMTLEELMEPVRHGVLIMNASFGMEDPLGGGIQCTSTKGCMIEEGEATTRLTAVSLAGRVLDLLKSIDGASRDFEMGVGTCGKGSEDYVPVGDGGCYLRISKAMISGG